MLQLLIVTRGQWENADVMADQLTVTNGIADRIAELKAEALFQSLFAESPLSRAPKLMLSLTNYSDQEESCSQSF
jgi:hypothetical protein